MDSQLNLTPWARLALRPDEIAGLHARCAVLGAWVSVTGSSPSGPWSVYATSRGGGARAAAIHAAGSLNLIVTTVLDDFRGQVDAIAADLAALGIA